MQKKAFAFICAFLLCLSVSGQDKKISIKGLIKNTSLLPVKDAHIINLTTRQGTISNENGEFEIPVSLGDWLEITNLQFTVKKIKVSLADIKEGRILIYLLERTNELKEVELKKKFTGFLEQDMIKKEPDTTPKLDKDYYNFSKMDLSKLPLDKRNKPPSSQLLTDPVAKVAGVSVASIGIPDKAYIKKRAQRKALNFKRSFANKLLERLGASFFFTSLKIPKERFPHFINYCSYLDIETLYKKDKILELIAILKKESNNYLKMIEKSK